MKRAGLWILIVGLILQVSCSNDRKEGVNKNEGKTFQDPIGRLDAWEFVGPGGGGAMFSPTVSPHDPGVALVSCDMTGSYITKNGGKSWRMFNLRGVVRFWVFDPLNPRVIYARSSALYRSLDGGDTWEVVYPSAEKITGIISKGDHAGERIVTEDSTSHTVLALALDPDNSRNIYSVIETGRKKALYKSEDGALSWERQIDLTGDIMNIFINPSSTIDQRILYITGKHALWVIHGQHRRMIQLPEAMGEVNSYAAGYSENEHDFILYAITGTSYYNSDGGKPGIFISRNGGESWDDVQAGLISSVTVGDDWPEWRAIATCQEHPEVIYVSYANLKVSRDTTYIGVAKSEDYGKTWRLVWKDNVGPSGPSVSSNFKSGWLNERFGPGWGENPFAIGVAPGNPEVCYATDFGRTVRTEDGGKTWEQVYTRKKEQGGWVSTGLQVTTNYMLAFNPRDTTHILMANTDTGILESHDGGQSWTSATQENGVPRAWVNSTYWVAFDPDVKDRVWAVMSRNHDLPRPKMWRNGAVDHYMGGVLVSDNAGKSWKPVSEDIGQAACTHILVDPVSTPGSRTLYVCAFGKGVYKSRDDGRNWQLKNKGISGETPFAWRITRRDQDGRLYLVVSRRSEDGSIGNEEDGALYYSDDGAESWNRMVLPEGTNGPTSLIIDPELPTRLLLSAWGRLTEGPFSPDTGGGIFLSEDDGKNWQEVLASDQHIHDLTMDARNDTFYACGFNASAYRSDDRGKSWQRIRGYNFKWGKRVEPDPLDTDKIYIITFGGGVWHGPAKGDPDAQEDIITPGLAFDVNR